MGTPVKSKLKLNKQLSEELIIAHNFWWWFFHLKWTLSSFQEHVKNFTYNFNANVGLSGQSPQFLQGVRVIKHVKDLTNSEDWTDTMETSWCFTENSPAFG